MDEPGKRRLALIELLDRDGRVLRQHDVHRWPLRLGRALDNDLVLDDPHVAAHHLTLTDEDGGGSSGIESADDHRDTSPLDVDAAAPAALLLQVGETDNGVLGLLPLPRRHWAAHCRLRLPSGALELQVGQTRLRLRRVDDTLAPEQPLPQRLAQPVVAPALAAALLAAGVTGMHWAALDPGADATAWLPLLVGVPVALALWCGLWALASQLFQHRFDFAGHLRIALPWLLAIEACDLVLEPLAASLGWPWLWRMSPLLQALLAAAMLNQHLLKVLPKARRAVGAFVAAALLAGLVISLTLTHRATDRWSGPPYMSTLPLAGWQWQEPVQAAALVQTLGPLAETLAQRVKKAAREEQSESEQD